MIRFDWRMRALIILAALLFGCLAWVQLAFWQMNRISPQFRFAAEYAYHLVRDCEERISAEGASFLACTNKAEDAVRSLSKLAVTRHEAIEYAQLHGYLIQVRECREDWESANNSPEAGERRKQLVRFRHTLEEWFK